MYNEHIKKVIYFCQLENWKPRVSTVLSMEIALITYVRCYDKALSGFFIYTKHLYYIYSAAATMTWLFWSNRNLVFLHKLYINCSRCFIRKSFMWYFHTRFCYADLILSSTYAVFRTLFGKLICVIFFWSLIYYYSSLMFSATGFIYNISYIITLLE